MRIEIRSTDSEQLGICASCTNASIAIGTNNRQVMARCQSFGTYIRFPVEQCSHYYDKNSRAVSLHTMSQTAWILGVDKGNNAIGFRTPKQWRKENKDDVLLPGRGDYYEL